MRGKEADRQTERNLQITIIKPYTTYLSDIFHSTPAYLWALSRYLGRRVLGNRTETTRVNLPTTTKEGSSRAARQHMKE